MKKIILHKEWLAIFNKIDFFDLGVSTLFALFLIYFSLPVFTLLNLGGSYVDGHSALVTTKSIFYSLLGILMFIIGYWVLGKAPNKEKPFSTTIKTWRHERVLIVFLGVFLAGFLTKLIRIINGSYLSFLYIDSTAPLFLIRFLISLNMFHFIALAIGFTYYYYLLKQNDPRSGAWKWIVWSVFYFEIFCGLITPGGRLTMILPILIFLITKHYMYKRSNLRIIVSGLLILFVLFPIKNVLRDVPSALNTYFGGDAHIYSANRALDIFGLWATGELTDLERFRRLALDPRNAWRLASDSSIGRIGQAHTFSMIVEQTQDYFYGRNLLYVFSQIGVPNSLIEKISGIDAGTDFGVRYGLVNESFTGVGPTVMGDLYLNFAIYGVIIGMLFFGYLFRIIFNLFQKSSSLTGLLFYSVLWIVFMHGFEQSLSSAYGKILQLSLILLGIHLFLTAHNPWGKKEPQGRNVEPSLASNA